MTGADALGAAAAEALAAMLPEVEVSGPTDAELAAMFPEPDLSGLQSEDELAAELEAALGPRGVFPG